MKILHLSATNIMATPDGKAEFERRLATLNTIASAGTQVDMWPNETGPLSIETDEDHARAVPGLLENAKKVRGYDAVTIGCFGDPGLEEIRRIVPVPVLGPGIAAYHAASLISSRFAVLSPVAETLEHARRHAARFGLDRKLVSVRSLDIPVLTIRQDRERAVRAAVALARACAEQDGAEAIVLGCMSMAFQRLDIEIGREVTVPVINPLIPLVRFAESLALGRLGPVP
ncbi:MAG: aspartate/glutamate racemase family protein [Bacillota bacterium]|nr:aspartate/glutamate racemase family protein [Bacillota bacterium]